MEQLDEERQMKKIQMALPNTNVICLQIRIMIYTNRHKTVAAQVNSWL